MEYFIGKLSQYFSETFSQINYISFYVEIDKISKTIILNDNYNIKLENFKNLVQIGKRNLDEEEKFIFHTYLLVLYLLDLHRDFKTDLLAFLKDKNNKAIYEKIVKIFLNFIISQESNEIINISRTKLKLFNNFYEAARMIIPEATMSQDETLVKLHFTFFSSFIKFDLDFHLKNVNDEVYQYLIMFFKYFYAFFKSLKAEYFEEIQSILSKNLEILHGHVRCFDFPQFNKDFEFNFSTSIFLLINITNKTQLDYINVSLPILQNFEDLPHNLLIYMKGFIINCAQMTEELILNLKLPCVTNFVTKYFLTDKNLNNNPGISLLEFYQLFLENDLRHNFTALINDLVLTAIHRLNKMHALESFFILNKTVEKILNKMSRDKNNFNIMDDNYYYLIECIHKESPVLANQVEILSNEYLNTLMVKKERLMMIEARMFKFISLKQNEGLDGINTMKSFFNFIFSRPYDKKNLSLINEYIKILLDYFFLMNSKDQQVLMKNYQTFLQVFPEPFFNYLFKVSVKDLKFLNNILINLEKFNKNFYSLVVSEFYHIYFKESKQCDYTQKVCILLTLLKPFRSHKKTLMIKGDYIIFDQVIVEKSLEVNFSISIEFLDNLTKLSDRYLVLYLIEFINSLDGPEKLFSIIKSLLKYNVKSSYIEYKSALMKALLVYFNEYIDKISKTLMKTKPNDNELLFISESLKNFEHLFKYLSDNIYDRPVENLLVYLEILNLNINLFDNTFYCFREKIKNDKMKILNENFIKLYEEIIFEKNLAYSLISLLRQSWYFVRFTVFLILKNKKFTSVLNDIKKILLLQIGESVYSLRQMDVEGSVNLFLLLLHHFKEEFFMDFFKNIIRSDCITEEKTPLKMTCLEKFQSLIDQRETNYLDYLRNKQSDPKVYECTVHGYFVFIRNILEEEKEGDGRYLDWELLLSLGRKIIKINEKFSEYLIHNGVSEFSMDMEDGVGDSENKGLISLWCSAKYSIEALNLILDTFCANFKILSKNANYSFIISELKEYQRSIISLMTDYKHMGAVLTLNESLLKVSTLLNRVEENYKEYREITAHWVKDFLEKKLINEDLCCTLRRSAGIPFILTTLIKSYIPQEKMSNFSHNKVNELLKSGIETLLMHYKNFILSRPDVAVHCLHILRVISDDTGLKPFAKDSYDFIILKIIDGLGNENWSIKNACMLLFSKLVKNSFTLQDLKQRNIPTFIEYFTGKDELKCKIFEILTSKKEACNDVLILLITFFSKFKVSKPAEINEEDLQQILVILFNLGYKNNKLFKKLLTLSIVKLYGTNLYLCQEKIIELLRNNPNNNQYDFLFNLVKYFSTDIKFIREIENILIEKFDSVQGNYFLLNKLVKYFSNYSQLNLSELIFQKSQLHLNEEKKLDFRTVYSLLIKNSKKPFYYKFIKNSLNYLLEKKYLKINNFSFDMIHSSNEELINFLMKSHANVFFSQFSHQSFVVDLLSNKYLEKLNVNISNKILDFLVNNENYYSDINLSEKLIQELLGLLNKNRAVTKLVKKLMKLILKLFLKINKPIYIGPILDMVTEFCSSNNEEEMRYISIQIFDSLIKSSTISTNKDYNLDKVLTIFVLILNDEHPEIRIMGGDIFVSFLHLSQISDFVPLENLTYSNEYLMDNLLNLINSLQDEYSESVQKVFVDLVERNMYFLESKIKLNSENKVFYYEPENRYVDNIEIKIQIMKHLLVSESGSKLKLLLNNYFSVTKEQNYPVKILLMLESFCDYLSKNFVRLKQYLVENTQESDKLDYPYRLLRNKIYDY